MLRILIAFALLLAPATLTAEPGDIDAAARGVVRVVIVGRDEEGVIPVSHGTGFVVAPGRIVTNAHVVRDAERDPDLRIAIVPPESGGAVLGRVVAIAQRRGCRRWQSPAARRRTAARSPRSAIR
jgi:serine protease Do